MSTGFESGSELTSMCKGVYTCMRVCAGKYWEGGLGGGGHVQECTQFKNYSCLKSTDLPLSTYLCVYNMLATVFSTSYFNCQCVQLCIHKKELIHIFPQIKCRLHAYSINTQRIQGGFCTYSAQETETYIHVSNKKNFLFCHFHTLYQQEQ